MYAAGGSFYEAIIYKLYRIPSRPVKQLITGYSLDLPYYFMVNNINEDEGDKTIMIGSSLEIKFPRTLQKILIKATAVVALTAVLACLWGLIGSIQPRACPTIRYRICLPPKIVGPL
jgi:hypothetical protein